MIWRSRQIQRRAHNRSEYATHMHALHIRSEDTSIDGELEILEEFLLVERLVLAKSLGQGKLERFVRLETLASESRRDSQLMSSGDGRCGHMSSGDLSERPNSGTFRVVYYGSNEHQIVRRIVMSICRQVVSGTYRHLESPCPRYHRRFPSSYPNRHHA